MGYPLRSAEDSCARGRADTGITSCWDAGRLQYSPESVGKADKPISEGEVHTVMIRLGIAIDALEKIVADLEPKLASVMSPIEGKKEPGCGLSVGMSCPLSQSLADQTARINQQVGKLEEVKERLQV